MEFGKFINTWCNSIFKFEKYLVTINFLNGIVLLTNYKQYKLSPKLDCSSFSKIYQTFYRLIEHGLKVQFHYLSSLRMPSVFLFI